MKKQIIFLLFIFITLGEHTELTALSEDSKIFTACSSWVGNAETFAILIAAKKSDTPEMFIIKFQADSFQCVLSVKPDRVDMHLFHPLGSAGYSSMMDQFAMLREKITEGETDSTVSDFFPFYLPETIRLFYFCPNPCS